MNQSQEIGELAKALAKAQAALKPAKKDSDNPYFKSKYADLTSIWEACREQLTANGLAIVQATDETDDGVIVVTKLIHSSGQWMEGRLKMKPVKNDPQGIGSCISYARRYALAAMVGVCTEDDDGNEASQPAQRQQTKKQPEQTKPAPPQVRSILALQMKHQLTNDQVLQIGGIETLKGISEEQAQEALNRLDYHVKEVLGHTS